MRHRWTLTVAYEIFDAFMNRERREAIHAPIIDDMADADALSAEA